MANLSLSLILFNICLFSNWDLSIGAYDPACCEEHSVGAVESKMSGFLMYTYNSELNTCVEFFFKGSGGNLNQFRNQKECEKLCVTLEDYENQSSPSSCIN
ncbi:protease inhibitor-like isoform X2 [Drosophila willistoni]|uniref:protease inhibitor-like isoform X2 n=1 Tax=Drosophila willistoni TaxID=7260 RepID=UPI001F075488|nr:protease inhibitor-like isoform X2 [Drosophila willistoni]